jgi:nitrogen fixation/metabolism regulation signal transduction histidine kinase
MQSENDSSLMSDFPRVVVDALEGPVWVLDREMTYQYINEYIETRTEVPAGEWIGTELTEMWERQFDSVENVQALQKANKRVLDGESQKEKTKVDVSIDGQSRTRIVKSVPLRSESRDQVPGVINIGRDISKLQTRERQLEVIDRVLRHNVRNELSVIRGNAEIIERLDHAEAQRQAEIIRTTSDRLLDTVYKEREIVELIRTDPQRRELDLVPLIQSLVESSADANAEASIRAELPESGSVIAIDQIGRAIEEMLEKAIERNDQAEPVVEVQLEEHNDAICVLVSDDGPGIPDEELGVLTGANIQPLYHGSGLGLWLVNWIVDVSGGSLYFEENDPRGSVIRVELPKAS